jgi:hypothetical protein
MTDMRRTANTLTGMLPDGARGKGAIYFCAGSRQTNMCSYTWRLWWGRTSFYIKARDQAAFADLKVSLHGPDERHADPGFKIERDIRAGREVPPPDGLVIAPADWLPCWFNGYAVADDARHAIRFRFPFGLFRPEYPSAPPPRDVTPRDFAALIPPPTKELSAVDVDIYVSARRPYWPKQRRARRDNACLGPLLNEAGQYLTAVVKHQSMATYPTPKRAQAPRPRGTEDRVRGVGATVGDNGLLWICEQWMSRAALREDSDERFV